MVLEFQGFRVLGFRILGFRMRIEGLGFRVLSGDSEDGMKVGGLKDPACIYSTISRWTFLYPAF